MVQIDTMIFPKFLIELSIFLAQNVLYFIMEQCFVVPIGFFILISCIFTYDRFDILFFYNIEGILEKWLFQHRRIPEL